MAQYKLHYFNGKGRAEVCRYMFALADQKYEDIRYERDVWPKHKPDMPFGQVPVLEVVDGSNSFKLPQSTTIYRYLANKLGFAGKSLEESAKIDAYADLINDMLAGMIVAFHESDEEKKKELFKKYFSETIHGFLVHFDKVLGESKSGYIVGDNISWVDLFLVVTWEWIPEEPRGHIFAAHAPCHAHFEKVKALPKIAEWIAKRPVTEM
jgi:glutathione S-transferase